MSTRWIASIGVVLCMAMTSFSLYLGTTEHVYRSKALRARTAEQVLPFDVCNAIQRMRNMTTTTGTALSDAIPCRGTHASR
jgi:hypothetical protein